MICQECGGNSILRFSTQGIYRGSHYWECSDFPNCKGTSLYTPKYTHLFSSKYMGWVVFNKLKELNNYDRIDLLNDIKGQMLKILEHYISCKVGACYSSIYKYILLDYLDDTKVLDYFLKSSAIKYGPSPIKQSSNGAKIFYDLFYDFMLVKSENIKTYLKNKFPEYYYMYQNRILPEEKYSFINYETNSVIEDEN